MGRRLSDRIYSGDQDVISFENFGRVYIDVSPVDGFFFKKMGLLMEC